MVLLKKIVCVYINPVKARERERYMVLLQKVFMVVDIIRKPVDARERERERESDLIDVFERSKPLDSIFIHSPFLLCVFQLHLVAVAVAVSTTTTTTTKRNQSNGLSSLAQVPAINWYIVRVYVSNLHIVLLKKVSLVGVYQHRRSKKKRESDRDRHSIAMLSKSRQSANLDLFILFPSTWVYVYT
mmetsp:Transcript_8249/g.8853  ORF Transcript_8249/g.8853 Transcript_8249/m.8853 type:complete len:186 (-) Transcript_8249:66-623(-)